MLRSSIDPTGLELVALMGYRWLCPPEDRSAQCWIHHRQRPVDLQERTLVQHGSTLTLVVRRTISATADSCDESGCSPHQPHAPLQPDTPPAHQTIDFADTIKAFELHVDSHFILPRFDMAEIGLLPQSTAWLQSWWSAEWGGQELWVYYDGSFTGRHGDCAPCAGAAAAAFVKVNGQWHFAGALSNSLTDCNAYKAELTGAALAIKFTHDLLKLFWAHGHAMPSVHHLFDSKTVGNQAAGHWQVKSAPLWEVLFAAFNFWSSTGLMCKSRPGTFEGTKVIQAMNLWIGSLKLLPMSKYSILPRTGFR